MDKSDTMATHPPPPAESQQSWVMGRALLSAGFFGTIGWVVGKYMGRHTNASGNRIAEWTMKSGMGLFFATLAAYSSFKAQEHPKPAESGAPSALRAMPDHAPDTPQNTQEHANHVPVSTVSQVSVATDQKLKEAEPVMCP